MATPNSWNEQYVELLAIPFNLGKSNCHQGGVGTNCLAIPKHNPHANLNHTLCYYLLLFFLPQQQEPKLYC